MHCIIYDICGDYGHGDSADCCDDRSGPSSLLSRVLNAGGTPHRYGSYAAYDSRRTRQMAH
jgi:hypothetical protein